MNILFLSLININSINDKGIYSDLLREFSNHGHNVTILSPVEKRNFLQKQVIKEGNSVIYQFKIGNIQKTKILEKGISTLTLERQFLKVLLKELKTTRFDLIIYTTPPITLEKVIRYIKNRDNAKTYLLLKDIFPQNALDLNLLSKKGFKGIIYKFFRNKEQRLYNISDYIGTMSKANMEYILKHNNLKSIVEVNPNSIEPFQIVKPNREKILEYYDIPNDKNLFIYGGNLGKPQGIDYLMNCILQNEKQDNNFILIVGDGTEFNRIDEFIKNNNLNNTKLIKYLPRDEFDKLVFVSDVGMVFLDHRFTIPNFPSRILSYMNFGKPILAATDNVSDVKSLIEDNNLGVWIYSNNKEQFIDAMNKILKNKETYGKNSNDYLKKNFTVSKSYNKIINKIMESEVN